MLQERNFYQFHNYILLPRFANFCPCQKGVITASSPRLQRCEVQTTDGRTDDGGTDHGTTKQGRIYPSFIDVGKKKKDRGLPASHGLRRKKKGENRKEGRILVDFLRVWKVQSRPGRGFDRPSLSLLTPLCIAAAAAVSPFFSFHFPKTNLSSSSSPLSLFLLPSGRADWHWEKKRKKKKEDKERKEGRRRGLVRCSSSFSSYCF